MEMLRRHGLLIAAVATTSFLRIALVYTASVPFNSDEAVVGLMARHINQGARPLFFYGQSYMGSLDAFLIAGAFRVLGETILAIRVIQILLYCAFLYTAWLLARRLLRSERAAGLAVLVMAVPPVLVATYTTATLGGYGESLVFGNLILLLGYEVIFGEGRRSWPAWGLLGLVSGLAFWTLGIAGVYMLPVVVLGILRFEKAMLPYIGLAAAAFLAGSAPWWVENFSNDWAALDILIGRSTLSLAPVSPGERVMGFLLLGLTALLGLRRPWQGFLEPAWILVIGLFLFLILIFFLVESIRRKRNIASPGAAAVLATFVFGFLLVFLGSNFGLDSTGRLLLPLYLPIGLGFGAMGAWLWERSRQSGIALIALVMGFNLICILRAAGDPAGLTTQFDPITEFNNDHDTALIDFLEENSLDYGFSNYWVTYRIAFLSGEEIVYSPRLPYKADLSYTPNDNRYPAYDAVASGEPEPAFITTQHPALDTILAAKWAAVGIEYREQTIGPFHVFYEFSAPVRPEEIVFP